MYLNVEPRSGCTVDNCHNNVIRYQSYMGGNRLLCAIVHRVSPTHKYYIFHSVWESDEGEVVDITPMPNGSNIVEVYFLNKKPNWKAVKIKDGVISYFR